MKSRAKDINSDGSKVCSSGVCSTFGVLCSSCASRGWSLTLESVLPDLSFNDSANCNLVFRSSHFGCFAGLHRHIVDHTVHVCS